MLKASFKARGQAKLDRLDQDETQRAVQRIRAASRCRAASPRRSRRRISRRSSIRPTASSSATGRAARRSRRAASGMPVSDDPTKPAGANCYACHQLDAAGDSYGTIGPSLYSFGKLRGYTDETRKLRVRQDLQRQGVHRLLEHAALRPHRHPDRAADPGRGRAAAGPGSRRSTSDAPRAAVAGVTRLAAAPMSAPRIPAGARRAPRSRGLPRRRRAMRRATTPTASASTTLPRVRQRRAAAHHRLPRAAAADVLPRAERQPRRRRRDAASRRISSARRCCKHFGIAPGTRDAHAFTLSRFRARGARATARSAASRISRRW